MKKLRAILASCGFATLLACGPSATTTPVVTSNAPAITGGSSLGPLLNADRVARGYGRLNFSPILANAAASHAADMNANSYFSHTGLNGSKLNNRVEAAGYCWRALAENIELGSTSEAQVHDRWMNSPGHFKNNMNAKVTEYGLGRSGNYWVLVLGKPC